MNKQENIILDLLKQVISDEAAIEIEKVELNADLKEDLWMDDIDYVNISSELENIGISLPMEMDEFKTIKDIVEYINERYQLNVNE